MHFMYEMHYECLTCILMQTVLHWKKFITKIISATSTTNTEIIRLEVDS
jgi:hypothetical protein